MSTTKVTGYNENKRPSFLDWMCKHNVSALTSCSAVAIGKAMDFN